MPAVTFVSDAHLGGGSPAVEAAKERDLVAFLDALPSGDALYLLGDLFDFWFDFGAPPPPAYGPVLRALERATRRGVRIAFMGGNHDFWARTLRRPGYLEREIGLALIGDPCPVTLQGMRLFLTHGDALGGSEGAYRFVRGVLRSPAAIRAFRILPQRLGYWLAARTSAVSRERHDEAARVRHRDALRAQALATLAAGGWDAVIAGHVHHPERIVTENGVYLNLGDWIEHRTYGRLCEGRLTLETFEPFEPRHEKSGTR
ncbi:MAG TPA: UDP-2,3-diacylglucosamine diphosphatase [Gemmatimonadota bacterium]|nr:UDP-2,3-diacylglucosamine diphosphatase [Gemmatimonadota bacterium]